MTKDPEIKTNKKIRGNSVAKIGIYRIQMSALVATKPDDKSLTQYLNDLLAEVLNT